MVFLPQPPIAVSIVKCPRNTLPVPNPNLLGEAVQEGVAQRCEEGRLKHALATVPPVRAALAGYDGPGALGAHLSRELAALPWLRGNQVEVHQRPEGPSVDEVLGRLQERHATSVLLTQVDYHLGPTAETVVVTAEVSLYTGEVKMRERSNGSKVRDPVMAYHGVLSTSAHLGDARKVLDGGFAELARMLAFDLGEGSAPSSEAPEGGMKAFVRVLAFPDAVGNVSYPCDSGGESAPQVMGTIVHASGGRSWVRLPTGELISFGEDYP